jgi:hypothetical protein
MDFCYGWKVGKDVGFDGDTVYVKKFSFFRLGTD